MGKRKLQTIHVTGHWVFPSDERILQGRKAYYVGPYTYKRKVFKGKRKKRLSIRVYPGKKIPPTPKGYVLEKHYDIEEPEERVVYTYKIEALVEYQGRYLMAFSLDKDLKGQKAIEFYHTKFEPTIERATVDFHEQMKLLNAYGHIVRFLSIDLYQVSGVGELKEKHWKFLKSFNEPDDVK